MLLFHLILYFGEKSFIFALSPAFWHFYWLSLFFSDTLVLTQRTTAQELGKTVSGCDEVLAVDSCAGGPVLAGAIHLLPLGQAEVEKSQQINIRVIRSQVVISLELKKSKFKNKCFKFFLLTAEPLSTRSSLMGLLFEDEGLKLQMKCI